MGAKLDLVWRRPLPAGGLDFVESYGVNSSKLPRYLEQEDAHLGLMIGDLSYALWVQRGGRGRTWAS